MTAQIEAAPALAARPIGRIPGLGGLIVTGIASLVLLVFLVAAVAPQLLTPYSPIELDTAAVLLPPSAAHPFGTDYAGRDIAARLIYGTRESLLGAGVAVVVGLVGGLILGVVASLFGRRADSTVSRFVDVLLSLPTLLVAIVIVTVLGFGTIYAGLAIGIASIGQFARLTRAQVMVARRTPFVEAGRIAGRGRLGNLAVHILPNVRGPIVALVPVQFGVAVLSLAALGFLGFGAQPPTPEWGAMIADGSTYIISGRWWTVAFPALVIVLFVFALNLVGRRLGRIAGGAL
jgi:ABC-type dipeptide/oligopeptide/nickel transport systems, permease components